MKLKVNDVVALKNSVVNTPNRAYDDTLITDTMIKQITKETNIVVKVDGDNVYLSSGFVLPSSVLNVVGEIVFYDKPIINDKKYKRTKREFNDTFDYLDYCVDKLFSK